ncbi:MAG: hypothetical protein GY839_02590, partial [candidate division Zixibacteria bacterium]|nr:hypothetical protein [candidate division Zixibacteria bacterium]
NFFDFLWISGDLSFTNSLLDYVTLTDGSTIGVAGDGIDDVEILTVGAHIDSAFAGIDGPYVSLEDTPSAMGFTLSDVDFAFATLSPKVSELATDLRSWTAIKALVGSASFVGINDISASIESLGLELNQGGGTNNGVENTTVVDFASAPLSIDTGAGDLITIDFAEDMLEASGAMTLSISSFVFVSGEFAFRKGGTTTATLSDTTTTKEVSVMTVGASDVDIFVGMNGPASESGAMGLSLENVAFGLALAKPTDTADTASYYGLKASADSVSLIGLDFLTLSVDNLDVIVNGTSDTVNPNLVVDFTKGDLDDDTSTTDVTRVKTGIDSYIDFDMTSKVIEASGAMTLSISSFVFVSGEFAFRKGGSTTATLSDTTTTKEVSVMTVGASDVDIFVGMNGPASES